jgi:hypothetical protein
MKKHETGKCPVCNEPIRPCGSAVVYHMTCLEKAQAENDFSDLVALDNLFKAAYNEPSGE